MSAMLPNLYFLDTNNNCMGQRPAFLFVPNDKVITLPAIGSAFISNDRVITLPAIGSLFFSFDDGQSFYELMTDGRKPFHDIELVREGSMRIILPALGINDQLKITDGKRIDFLETTYDLQDAPLPGDINIVRL